MCINKKNFFATFVFFLLLGALPFVSFIYSFTTFNQKLAQITHSSTSIIPTGLLAQHRKHYDKFIAEKGKELLLKKFELPLKEKDFQKSQTQNLVAQSVELENETSHKRPTKFNKVLSSPVKVKTKKVVLKVAKKTLPKKNVRNAVAQKRISSVSSPLSSLKKLKGSEDVNHYGFQINTQHLATNWTQLVSQVDLRFQKNKNPQKKMVAKNNKDNKDKMDELVVADEVNLQLAQKVAYSISDETKNSLAQTTHAKLDDVHEKDIMNQINNDAQKRIVPVEENAQTLLASAETNTQKNGESDDLIFFDYSKDNKNSAQNDNNKVAKNISANKEINNPKILAASGVSSQSNKISASVLQAIQREMDKTSHVAKVTNQNKNTKMDIQKVKKILAASKKVKSSKNSYKNNSVFYKVAIQKFDFKKGFGKPLSDFALNNVLKDEFAQTDNGTGTIAVEKVLNMAESIIFSSVEKAGFVSTLFDIVLNKNTSDEIQYIPMISEESFHAFLSENDLSGRGGHLFIDLHEDTMNIKLDTVPEKVFYFNEDWRPSKEDARYAFFAGIPQGNVLLTYYLADGTTTEKIIHIEDNKILFEYNEFEINDKKVMTFFDEGLLNQGKKSPLDLGVSQILSFNSSAHYTLGKDAHEFVKTITPFGSRKYIELKHLSDSIFIGHHNASEVSIPSERYILTVLDLFEVQELNDRCLLHVNLQKPAKAIDVGGKTGDVGLYLDLKFLDKDGKFYDSISQYTSKVFVLGEAIDQGIMNLKVTYIDGSVDYLKSFCSKDTYLIEELQ